MTRKETVEDKIMRLTKTHALTPVAISAKLGYTGYAKADAIRAIVAMGRDGRLVRSWDEEGECYYRAA